ncbi:MAG TPA: hypothetical protein PKY56_01335 [Candidatus Kapabacteria bacterium]|nr:hypothetical protein [Candidatus Kapabacteria bacterium]HPO62271.1 hypothetical protein [Candidatus Kapabacteria bacterium]
MKTLTYKCTEEQLVSFLMQFSMNEISSVLKKLINKKVYKPIQLDDICKQVELHIEKNSIDENTVAEGIKWARNQK